MTFQVVRGRRPAILAMEDKGWTWVGRGSRVGGRRAPPRRVKAWIVSV